MVKLPPILLHGVASDKPDDVDARSVFFYCILVYERSKKFADFDFWI